MLLGDHLIRSFVSFVGRGANHRPIRHVSANDSPPAWVQRPGQARIALPEAIEIAESALLGVAIEACASDEDEKITYRIEVIRDYALYAVSVDAQTGTVTQTLDIGLLEGAWASRDTIGRLLLSKLAADREHI